MEHPSLLSIHHRLLLLWLMCVDLAAAAGDVPPAVRPGCRPRCGDVDIPFPFGIGDRCALHHGFDVDCARVNGTDRPFMGPFEVTGISIPTAKARVKMNISWRCYDFDERHMRRYTSAANFTHTPFRFSYEDNKVFVMGCNTLAYMMGNPFITGCYTTCFGRDDIKKNGSCSPGAGCCEMDVPENLGYFSADFNEYYNTSGACSYIVVMEKKAFSYSTTYRTSSSFWHAHNGTVPVVMDWRVNLYNNYTCENAKLNNSSYACVSNNSECVNSTNGPGYRCRCRDGYQGNPYVRDKGGCTDIDECRSKTDNCTARGATSCHNTLGSYNCSCSEGQTMVNEMCMENHKPSPWEIPVVLGASVGLVALIVTTTWAYLFQQSRKLHHIKQKYFQQHGGMLLLEEIKSEQGFKMFTEEQLQEATENFNEKLVLGHGGHGTVYKGLLEGSVEVAIKRCMSIDEQHKKEFGKEILILSQINHRNIVKLLGCCLEVQVPMLVFEYIPNGTLFQLIHGNHIRQISLVTRIQIAHQSAEALAYLHSWASPPIYHGDVKSSNILIDRDYTAKVSDFGASILAPTDESQFVTIVQGTCGYLDPEYMQTYQLTDKSDVYSFGVVLLELLTRKKPFKFEGPEDEKSLALKFISMVKEGKLEEILDDQIKNDENMVVLEEAAELALQCLAISGVNRPSMKEVSERLDSLRKVMQHAQQQQNPEEMESLLGESSLARSEVVVSTGNLSIEMEAVRSLEWGR